jgi:hypothetical protein
MQHQARSDGKYLDKAFKGLGKANALASDMQAIFCNQMLHNMLYSAMLTAVNKTMHATCSVAGIRHLLYVSFFAK